MYSNDNGTMLNGRACCLIVKVLYLMRLFQFYGMIRETFCLIVKLHIVVEDTMDSEGFYTL